MNKYISEILSRPFIYLVRVRTILRHVRRAQFLDTVNPWMQLTLNIPRGGPLRTPEGDFL